MHQEKLSPYDDAVVLLRQQGHKSIAACLMQGELVTVDYGWIQDEDGEWYRGRVFIELPQDVYDRLIQFSDWFNLILEAICETRQYLQIEELRVLPTINQTDAQKSIVGGNSASGVVHEDSQLVIRTLLRPKRESKCPVPIG